MAADLKEAVDNFIATSSTFRGLFELADQLKAVGDADRLASEAENRRTVAEDALAKATADADAVRDSASAEAAKILSNARDSAAKTASDAKAKAAKTEADARAAADKMAGKAKADAEEAMALAAANEGAARDAERRLLAAQGQLADLNVKIANARETIAGLLKG